MGLHSLTQITFRPDDADSIIRVLEAVGVPLPKNEGDILSASAHLSVLAAEGKGISEHQLDEALAKTELPLADRIAVKLACQRHRLLRRAA